MTLEKLGAVNGKNCECSGNSCGGTLVPSRDVTPAYTKDEDVPADSSCIDEMKFLSCGHYIWPWIKRSLSLDLISNDSKPKLVLVCGVIIFQNRSCFTLCSTRVFSFRRNILRKENKPLSM